MQDSDKDIGSVFLLNRKIRESMQPDHVAEMEQPGSSRRRARTTQKQPPQSLEATYRRRVQQYQALRKGRANAAKVGESILKESAKNVIQVVKKEKEEEMAEKGLLSSQWKWKPSRAEMAELVGAARHQFKYQPLPRPPLDEQELPRELREEIA